MLRRRSLPAVVLLVAVNACFVHHAEEPPAPLRSPVRDSLLFADAGRGELATQRGLATAAGAWLDSNVIYLRPGAPIVYGRANALAIIADSAPEHARYQWRPIGGNVSRDGASGYSYGTAITALPNGDGAPSVRSEYYIAFWRRASDGVWRVQAYADIGGTPMTGGVSVPGAEFPPLVSIRGGSRADAVRRVRSADSAFALAADLQGTGIAFASYTAPQGVIFSGSELVIGSEAMRALYDEQQRAGGTLNWRPVYANAAGSADLGFTVGEYVFTGRGINGTVVQRFGKYLTIWKMQPGGDWRFVVDGGNVSPTPNR